MPSATATLKPAMLRILLAASLLSLASAQAAAAGPPGAAWQRHTIDDSSRGADGVRLADVNHDGLLDIVIGWEEGGVTRVYLHPGYARANERWPSITVGRTPSVEDAVFVDLDGDGAVDVVSSSEGRTRAMHVHWAPTERDRYREADAWRMEPLPAAAGAMMWMFCLPLQIDGRHGPDLVAAGKGDGAALGWFSAPRDARRLADWKWHPLRPVGWVMSLLAHDMDGDGDQDIVFSDRKGARTGCFWLERPNRAAELPHPWKEHHIGLAGREVMFIALADLDGDGVQDVLACVSPASLFWLRRAGADSSHWTEHALPVPTFSGLPKAVAVGDLDLDGRLDIVVTCENAVAPKHGVWWLRNTGKAGAGAWEPRTLGGVDGVKHDLVELLDLDGDGDLDVLTCEERTGLGVFWYENPAR